MASPRGLLLEGLVLCESLCGTAEAQARFVHGVSELRTLSVPAWRSPREVSRAEDGTARLVLVSDYVQGVRLASWLSQRRGAPLATATVLHVAREIAFTLREVTSLVPGLLHGSLGLERVLLTPDGRVVVVEPGLAPLTRDAEPRSAQQWWSDFRIAVPVAPGAEPFGPWTDACQLGVVVLQLLLGRSLAADEYPDRLPALLGRLEEVDLVGRASPLGAALFEWLAHALLFDGSGEAPTIAVVADALDDVLSDSAGYVAVPVEGPIEPEHLEPCGDLPHLSIAGGRSEIDSLVHTTPGVTRRYEHLTVLPTPSKAAEDPSLGTTKALPLDQRVASPLTAGVRPASKSPGHQSGARPWRPAFLRWGAVAVMTTVLLTAASSLWVTSRRTVAETTATIEIDSQPTGATLIVDGVERGQTPTQVLATPGRHEIVVKSAHGSGRKVVEVDAAGRTRVFVPLTFGTAPGSLEVASEPPGADVLLDDVPQGRAPVTIAGVRPGEHTLVIQNSAARAQRRLTIAPGERVTVSVPLAGWVAARSRVPLEVFDRDRLLGDTTQARLLVPAGRRSLRFVNRELGVTALYDVLVVAGGTTALDVSPGSGVLSVASDPPAELSLDGTPLGRTPTGSLSVPVGEHELVLRHPKHGEQRFTVVVGVGAPTRLKLNLRK